MGYERKKYKTNFLDRVIFQLRFDPILSLENESPSEFQTLIRESYPGLQQSELVQIEEQGPSKKVVKRVTQYDFISADNTHITVTPIQFSLEYFDYESIEVMVSDFETAWGHFQSIYKVPSLSRVGLRYIDVITVDAASDPLVWDGYLSEEIVAATLGISGPSDLSLGRSMHRLDWVGDDYRLSFQFGLHNPDFPNPIGKREFTLDCDCVSIGATDSSDVLELLNQFHDQTGALFEKSIGGELRKHMGNSD